MPNNFSELVGKINFGLKNFRELFRLQGMINARVDARIGALEKEIDRLEKELYSVVYNIMDGMENKK